MNDSDESSLEKEIEFFLNALCEKQKDTETPINCDSSRVERLIKSLYNTQEGIIGSRDKIKRDIDNWEDKLKHQEDLAKMHISRSISSDAVCVSNYKNYIDRHDRLYQKTERRNSLNRDIQNYELQKSNLGEFEKIVNHVFEQEGIPFSIRVDDTGHSYTLVSKEDPLSSTRAPITANDLSEGEIRLLGFLHFYLSLYEGTKIRNSEKEKINLQQFSPTVDTIVIDDPVTSLDLNNRFTLLEIINKLSKQVVDQHKQLFILTHSPFDFNDYAFHCSKDNKTRLRIYKDENGNSVIARYEHDVFNNYYHEQFNFVMQFALDGKENIQLIENPVKYANPMRFVLESHARTHYGISDFTQKNYDKIKEKYLIPEEWNKDEIINAINLINELSHGLSFMDSGAQAMSTRSVQKAIRQLICVLYNKDPQHIESLYQPTSKRKWSNAKRSIQEWKQGLVQA